MTRLPPPALMVSVKAPTRPGERLICFGGGGRSPNPGRNGGVVPAVRQISRFCSPFAGHFSGVCSADIRCLFGPFTPDMLVFGCPISRELSALIYRLSPFRKPDA